MIFFILLWISQISLSQLQNDITCYYEYDDSILEQKQQKPQIKQIEIQADAISGDSRGFGFWSKYIANLVNSEEEYLYKPFDDPNCLFQVCQFNGFYFLKLLDDDQFNFAAIILNMNDNPISLTHDFYLFKQNSDIIQQASVKFQASLYENIWFYTSILYSSVDHLIRFYTNFNDQLFTLEYLLLSEKITIILGGYTTDLSQNIINNWSPLLHFKGKLSTIQEYNPFFYDDDFFYNLFQKCPYQAQKTTKIKYDVFRTLDPNIVQDDLQINLLQISTPNLRYTIRGWIKQNYMQAFSYYLQYFGEPFYQIDQPIFYFQYPFYVYNRKQGDLMIEFYYKVDFENNNETEIHIEVEFYKIPLGVPLYQDEELRKFDSLTIKKDNFYEKTQEWHYFVIDQGRTPKDGSAMQIRFYFRNEEPYIYNLGTYDYNTQYSGYMVTMIMLFRSQGLQIRSSANLNQLFIIVGQQEDDNDGYLCDSSCRDCIGPTKNDCVSCYTELNYFLTQFNSCECLYLNEYNQKSGICEPIERSQSLSITKEEDTEQFCQFGYFQVQFNNEYFCIKCPSGQEMNFLCGDCLHQSTTWYLKPICTFDYIQEQSTYAYIKRLRSNIQIDVYYINNDMNLQLQEGASEFCEATQLGCQNSNEFHLGVQIRMKCKTNRYYNNFQCLNCIESCILCQSKDVCLTCIENYFFNFKEKVCSPCPKECKTCQNAPSSILGYQCLSCQSQYTVNHFGQCQQCGIYCEFCIEDFNAQTQEYFVRCLTCVDNNKMTIRFNGVDCIILDIPNCQNVVLMSKTSPVYNALIYNFQPSNDLSDEKPICGLCQQSFAYNYELDMCDSLDLDASTCSIAYIVRLIVLGVDYGLQQICLKSPSQGGLSIEGDFCNTQLQNCLWCYTKKQKTNAYCLKCQQGYYSQRLTGQCQLCPENLHCKTCYHTTIGYNDEWKNNLILFIEFLKAQHDISYFYWSYDQSQNLDDYEIICTSCYTGYILRDNKCIKYCEDSCQSCIYLDGQYICQTCGQNIYHNLLSLVQNQCTVCPSYCEFCRERTYDEIQSINSLFIKTDINTIYTYQCLKPYQNDETLIYDSILGQFISCQNSEQCENVLTFEFNLFCNDEDYHAKLELIQDSELKNKFKKENVMFSQILQSNVQGNSFQIFDIDAIYDIMGKKTIKKVKLILVSNSEQVCQVPQLSYITQAFSKNVFQAIDVQLTIKSNIEKELQIVIFEEIHFTDFTLLRFENVQFMIQSNIYNKNINAYGFKSIELQLYKIVISTTSLTTSTFFTFQCTQLNQIVFSQVILRDMNIQNKNQKSFFSFLYDTISKTSSIQIENFSIEHSIFENTNILEFKSTDIQSINFNHININSVFMNSSLLNTQNDEILKSIIIANFIIQGKIENSEPFFLLNYAQSTNIQNVDLIDLVIIDSTFLQLERSGSISELLISDCHSFGSVSFIRNNVESQISKQIGFIYSIDNLKVTNLISSYETEILYFQAFDSITSEIIIKNIILEQVIIDEQQQSAYNQLQSYLIYIQLKQALVQSCKIVRGLGIQEFIFTNLQSLIFTDLIATQSQILLLHQYYDCSSIIKANNKYPSIIQLFDVRNTKLENFVITRMNFINSGFLLFTTQSKTSSSDQDALSINNLIIKDNLLITSQKDASASLMQITSNQKIIVNIEVVEIKQNQLHNYQKNLLKASSVAMLIYCPSGIINFRNSQIYDNFATNTTDSVINIISEQILFDQIQFVNNSYQNIEILVNNIDWQYPLSQIIYKNDLKSIFDFQNAYGNSYLEADVVVVQNSQVENSQGLNGIGLYISGQIVKLFNIQFKNLTTFFKYNEENGGCIFIKIPISGCKVELSGIVAQNILAKDYGSFLFVSSNQDQLHLSINNLTLSECISRKGSVIHAAFQKNSLQNVIQLQKIIIKNQKSALFNYMKQQINNQKALLDINNLVSIYVENTVLILKDIFIDNIFRESILEGVDQGDVILNKITILGGTAPQNNIILIQPREDLSTVILIKIISINNVKQVEKQNEQCEIVQNTISQKIIYMQCNSKATSEIPIFLKEDDKDKFQENECLNQKLQFSNTAIQLSAISISKIKSNDLISMFDISLSNNYYSNSLSGLVNLYINKQNLDAYSIVIKDLIILKNCCGQAGCLYINYDVFDVTAVMYTQNRLLASNSEKILQLVNHDIIINNYKCQENVADFGTCLLSNQTNIIVFNSIFIKNKALVAGGAIYFSGKQSFLFLVDSQIINNNASIAGAIYFDNSVRQDMKQYNTIVFDNQASYYGQNEVQAPTHLSITLNNYHYIYNTIIEQNTRNSLIESIDNQLESDQNVIYLPSGTPIKEYQKFNQISEQLEPMNFTFRIVALDDYYSKLNNLTNSNCTLETFVFDIEKNIAQETSNQILINKKSVLFDSNTNDYNLDDLVIYFDSDNTNKTYLQLVISCSCIQIPQYDENKVIIQSFHNNYKLFVNINTFKCRVGQIKSIQDNSCHECDPNLDQYSNQLNLNKCYIRDEQSTINVTSFGLNLRSGYWRPYFENNIVEECLNLRENCLGGWNSGDISCYKGHIGALCEQCDIWNIRGGGSFSTSQQYSCGSCDNVSYNLVQIIGFSIWSLITIVLSVKGANSVQSYQLESPYLIKILTNYLQIISSLTSFKLRLPVDVFYFLNGIGNPIQRISYSLDCYLIEMSTLEIHYLRLIWQLLIPCFYFSILSIVYSILISTKQLIYRGPIVMTAIIYMYIYFQPSIIGSLIALISTRTISNVPLIQANVAFKFDTPTHLKWVLTFCIPFLSLFGILIPLGLLLSLCKIRNKLIYKRGKSLLGYLYYEYKPNAYFWEIIKIVDKELLILVLIYYEDSIILKGSLIYFILFSYWSLNLKYQPFKSARLNQLDYQSTIICEISIIIGIGLNMGQQSQFYNISVIFFFTLIIINIFFLIKILLYIFNAYMNEMEKTFDLVKSTIHKNLPNRFRMSKQCLRLLKTNAESRERAKLNFQKLKTAYKKLQASKRQSMNIVLYNAMNSQQITTRLNTFSIRENLPNLPLVQISSKQ
ncbi:unnamed protein product [Paramecium octaurelia]|uniref:Transmembrane protein n=1 Tax=Paramecium octaurelia TaxID=43137 RepID=A0A8S1T4A8_PAROT|nr:unnamed protein product [Paramecium octaurelia]